MTTKRTRIRQDRGGGDAIKVLVQRVEYYEDGNSVLVYYTTHLPSSETSDMNGEERKGAVRESS